MWHLKSLLLFLWFFAGLGFLHFEKNSNYLENSNIILQNWSTNLYSPSHSEYENAKWMLKRKSLFYNNLIEENHLLKGMVINFSAKRILDQCDSLLFSSLRYSALKSLHLDSAAENAWEGIYSSSENGQWWRHPYCKDRAISKDMLLGIIIALDNQPEHSEVAIADLLERIERNNGFFANGPIFLSYLTPNIAVHLKRLAKQANIPYSDMPNVVRRNYSTSEFSHYFIDGGYRSHLISLGTWVSLKEPSPKNTFQSILTTWNTHKLVSINASLFNRYLRLYSAGALNRQTRYQLMTELLNMRSQFPDDRLPMDCDRKADYLWQRNFWESYDRNKQCSKTFNGIDFLWMAALLTDDQPGQMHSH